jgi:hypothetical protein|tara:strand:+ start:17 stop:748 length:732 start_codon:yes stop_codon:yes gene_type:complete
LRDLKKMAGAHLDTHVVLEDARITAASAQRNVEPLWEVLERVLPAPKSESEEATPPLLLLEIASGCGLHGSTFAKRRPDISFQPTEFDASLLASIAAWSAELSNVRAPRSLDVTAQPWANAEGLSDIGDASLDFILNVNMVHISPFNVCEALFSGAGTALRDGGAMLMYGPFVVEDVPTAPSNERFDAVLRERDARWGLRSVEAELLPLAAKAGLVLEERIAMPANNFCLLWRKALATVARIK